MADALLEDTSRLATPTLQVRLLRRCYLSPLLFYLHNTPLDISYRFRLASNGPPILRNIDSGRRPRETVKRSCAICYPKRLPGRPMLVIFVLLHCRCRVISRI